jgi:hypothetical protein
LKKKVHSKDTEGGALLESWNQASSVIEENDVLQVLSHSKNTRQGRDEMKRKQDAFIQAAEQLDITPFLMRAAAEQPKARRRIAELFQKTADGDEPAGQDLRKVYDRYYYERGVITAEYCRQAEPFVRDFLQKSQPGHELAEQIFPKIMEAGWPGLWKYVKESPDEVHIGANEIQNYFAETREGTEGEAEKLKNYAHAPESGMTFGRPFL